MNTAMEGVCASSNKADARDYSLLYIYNPQQVAMLLAILCHVVAILSRCLFIQMLVLFAMPQQTSQNPSLQLLMSGLGEKRKSSTGPKSSSPANKPVLSPNTPSATSSPRKKKNMSRRRRVAEEEHIPSQHPITSSPPKTPKSPSGA